MDETEDLLFQKGFDTLATEAHERAMFEGDQREVYLDAVDNGFPLTPYNDGVAQKRMDS